MPLFTFFVLLISYHAGPDSGINAPLLESLWAPFIQIAGPVLDAVTYHMYLGYGGMVTYIRIRTYMAVCYHAQMRQQHHKAHTLIRACIRIRTHEACP